jgi:hypothetical protein
VAVAGSASLPFAVELARSQFRQLIQPLHPRARIDFASSAASAARSSSRRSIFAYRRCHRSRAAISRGRTAIAAVAHKKCAKAGEATGATSSSDYEIHR